MNYFFDSYAIIEIIKDNPNYETFQNQSIITNSLNISEVYYHLLNVTDKSSANTIIENLDIQIVEMTKEIAIKAAQFRYENKKAKMSYADCIGYISAQQNNIIFLTGDKEFLQFDNVEFVK